MSHNNTIVCHTITQLSVCHTITQLSVCHTITQLSVYHTIIQLSVCHTITQLSVCHTVTQLSVYHTITQLSVCHTIKQLSVCYTIIHRVTATLVFSGATVRLCISYHYNVTLTNKHNTTHPIYRFYIQHCYMFRLTTSAIISLASVHTNNKQSLPTDSAVNCYSDNSNYV